MEAGGRRPLSMLAILALASAAAGVMPTLHPSPAIKGAYWPSWVMNFPPSAIDTSLFTHVFYAFLTPNPVTFRLDVDGPTGLSLSGFSSVLHAKEPPVKALFSIGGGGEDPLVFSRMALSSSSRTSFIRSTIEVARKYGLDGMDLDWEFPQDKADMDNFGLLLRDWRAEVEKEAKATGKPPLLLSAATYFSFDFFLPGVYRTYPADSINDNLDWINLMCYDYHSSWDTSATGAHAALFDPASNISTSRGLRSWIRAGVPRSKLVMGLPLYGRTWRLRDPGSHGVGAPAVAVGPGNGTLFYYQVEEFNKKNNATVGFDWPTVSAYSFAGTDWIGYDDVRSVTVKIAYAKGLRLRGYFFWALSYDSNWKISRRAFESWGP